MRTCNILSFKFDKKDRSEIDLYDLTSVIGFSGFGTSATFQNDGK